VSNPAFWLIIGFIGQTLFTARFLVQWVASERKHDSVVPVSFWWLSLAGGVALLCYALFRQDPVIATGQALGLCIYVRNLMLGSGGKYRGVRHAAPSPRGTGSASSVHTLG
jgi:lipid-A-disaccharide synthase-like uncharacterized protein